MRQTISYQRLLCVFILSLFAAYMFFSYMNLTREDVFSVDRTPSSFLRSPRPLDVAKQHVMDQYSHKFNANPLNQFPGVSDALRKAFFPSLADISYQYDPKQDEITYVSGAFNIGRKSHRTVHVGRGEEYSFENDYIRRLNSLLAWGAKTEVVVEPRYSYAVKRPNPEHQQVREVSVEELQEGFKWYDAIQEIRKDPKWLNQVSWLRDSPQANTALYNVVVMSKLYFLADTCERNPFDTRYFVWLDAGVCTETMIGPKNMQQLETRMRAYMRSDRLWICHAPYPSGPEVHGFPRHALHEMAGQPVHWVPKGGMFGGTCNAIKRALVAYDDAISNTLSKGLMGTEETIFALLHATHPHLFEACANEKKAQPNVETMCQFLDDNYDGFGEPTQLTIRSSPKALQDKRYN